MENSEIRIKEPNIFKRFLEGAKVFFTKSVPNFFTKKIPNFFKAIGRGVKNFCVNFVKRFKEGSIGTKISHVIMGFGNIYHGQIVKGIIYFAIEVLFVLYMVLCPCVTGPGGVQVPTGYKALGNLALQGEEGKGFDPVTFETIPDDSSQLFLLFGLVSIAIIILFIILYLSNIKSSFKADTDVKAGKKPTTFVEDLKELLDSRFHVLMISPTCIAALVFTVLPTIFMICIAFTTYNDIDMQQEPVTSLFHWNGLSNFGAIFSGESTLGKEINGRFLPILGWTIVWAFFATFTCYFGGIILALLINKKGLKGKKVFRTIFILTIAIPQFISLLAMRNLLSGEGPLNSLLISWGWIEEPISFLGMRATDKDPTLARTMVIVINMWLGIPYTMLMTSGILMNIPSDLYEAARVDGTSRLKMFFKITLPYVVFVTTPYLISSFIGNINSFNTIFLLTGGGPSVGTYKGGGTDLLVTWLYKLTIDNGMYNTGAVVGILTFLITSTITLITYRNSKAYNEEDTFQ